MILNDLYPIVGYLIDAFPTKDTVSWTEGRKAQEMKTRAAILFPHVEQFEAHIVKAAAVAYIGRPGARFYPAASEVLECIRDILTEAADVPDGDSAWMQVKAFAARFGRDEFPAVEMWPHPLVREATKAIGWRTICLGDEDQESYRRHQFIQTYGNLVTRAQKEQMMAPVVRATIMQLADAMGRPKQIVPPMAPPALPAPTGREYETAREGETFRSLAQEFRRHMASLPPLPRKGQNGKN